MLPIMFSLNVAKLMFAEYKTKQKDKLAILGVKPPECCSMDFCIPPMLRIYKTCSIQSV